MIQLWAAMLALYIVWGSTFIAIRVAVETIPPFLMAGIRFAIAGLIVVAWTALRHGGLPRVTRREVRDTTIVGGLLLGGGMGLVAWGEQTVPAGIAALLIALMPAWLAIFGRTLLGDRLHPLVVIGIALGFVGVAVLVAPTDAGGVDLAGVIALLVSPIAWSLGSLYAARRATLPQNGLFASGLQMLAGAGVLAIQGVVTGELAAVDLAGVSVRSGLGLAYLIFVGSLVGYSAYGFLLRTAPLPLVSTYAYVNPVVAIVLGALLLAEPLGPRILAGSAVIVVGVALIVTKGSTPRSAVQPRRVRPTGAPPVDASPTGEVRPARTPAPATARTGAADPRGNRGRSQPG